jgi:hypothetical protein
MKERRTILQNRCAIPNAQNGNAPIRFQDKRQDQHTKTPQVPNNFRHPEIVRMRLVRTCPPSCKTSIAYIALHTRLLKAFPWQILRLFL